jgi:uncharacterized membrane protein
LSDGIFAVAMTLIVLEIHVPPHAAIHSEAELLTAIADLAPRFLMYLTSFLTLGIFRMGQQTQLNQLARADRDVAWIHLVFLALVVLLPFSTSLLAEFLHFRTALLLYWANILALGLAQLASWRCAQASGLIKPDMGADLVAAIYRRVIVAQAGYGAGAALCVFGTTWSIGVILALQAYFAFAPRLRPLRSGA